MDPIDEVMTDAGSQQPVFADASVEATIASLPPLEQPSLTTNVYSYPTAGSFSNKALQRSIALALKQIGFDSATPQALDSFAQHAESYLQNLIKDVHHLALSARREVPTPNDFQLTLQRRNICVNDLKLHRKHPIPRSLLQPKTEVVGISAVPNPVLKSLPILHPDLSGASERAAMEYIPSKFPEFPSIHTFRHTPRMEKSERDPQKIRTAAALAAKQGEDALRGLVRAAKVRKQKEVRSIVQREMHGKERYRLWEAAMQKLLSDKANGPGSGARTRLSDQEIADSSMIVNSGAPYLRQELPRTGAGKRALPRTNLEIHGP